MTVREIVDALGLEVCCGQEGLGRTVAGGYAGDLLSDVIANTAGGDVWITMQVHVNIVAVAVLRDLAAIILVNGRRPAEETRTRAAEEHLPLLSSPLSAYAVAGKLYALGVGHGD